VLNAGVLFALPALISQGLERFFKVFNPLPPGFYGLHHIILILCFMALCRIKNPEQLKKHPPGELGKLLGLDRIPEVGYFRAKIRQITDQSRADELHTALLRSMDRRNAGAVFLYWYGRMSGFTMGKWRIFPNGLYRAKNFA